MSIPRIRLPAAAHDTASQPTTTRQLDKALREIGFVGLTDTGMPPELLRRVFQHTHAFFEQDATAKARYAYRSASENFGYQGLQQEHLDPSKPADVKETFTMRNIERYGDTDPRWPPGGFFQCMSEFHRAAMSIVERLERELADLLEIPPDFFTNSHSGENVSLRLLHYPTIDATSLQPEQLGAGAHTDYGLLTLLFQHEVGGLEVLNQHNEWVSVAYEPDLVVVNSGDLLERWTNGRYRSTRHRVPPQTGGRDRYSIALFVDPDSAVEITPFASCIDAEHPCEYLATTAGAHIQAKITASHRGLLDT